MKIDEMYNKMKIRITNFLFKSVLYFFMIIVLVLTIVGIAFIGIYIAIIMIVAIIVASVIFFYNIRMRNRNTP